MTPTATLDPTDQAREALVKANAVRSERVRLRNAVAAGEVDVRDLILDPPEMIRPSVGARQPVTVARLLSWQHRWGTRRAAKLLGPLGIGPYVTPFDLSRTRREQIVRRLG